jgi:hypothetical protein
MGFFRCMNQFCASGPHGKLGHDFEGAVPVCPKCASDARLPRYAHLIQQLETIHYDPPDPKVFGMGQGILACRPDFHWTEPGRDRRAYHVSGVKEAVNCPVCKASPLFLADEPDREATKPPVGDLTNGPPLESIPEQFRDVELRVQQTREGPALVKAS